MVRCQQERHAATRNDTSRYDTTRSLNQRVRGSSPWRRTSNIQVNFHVDLDVCYSRQFTHIVHSGRVWARHGQRLHELARRGPHKRHLPVSIDDGHGQVDA